MDIKSTREGKAPEGKICAACGSFEGITLKHKVCSNCKSVYYCSQECQRVHWKNGHKEQCKILKAEYLKSVGGQVKVARN